jgi:hypothetical protein
MVCRAKPGNDRRALYEARSVTIIGAVPIQCPLWSDSPIVSTKKPSSIGASRPGMREEAITESG